MKSTILERSKADPEVRVQLFPRIKAKAYELWLEHGKKQGNDWFYWFEAERIENIKQMYRNIFNERRMNHSL